MVSYRNGFINNHYMKDFHELLRLRRSTRKFTEQEIASDDVKTIMEAALMAPFMKERFLCLRLMRDVRKKNMPIAKILWNIF